MSGDWMKVELSLPEKPEVFQIAGVLNIDPDLVVGKLIKVWSWFDRQTQNGNAHGVTFALVDRLTGVAGFGDAMANAGWLTQRGMSLVVPSFDKHNGKTAKTRALSSKRQQRFRNDVVDDYVTQEALPREEKRREEEKIPPTPKGGGGFEARRMQLPEWLPLDVWERWCSHREQIRHRLTELTAGQQLKRIVDWHSRGLDPVSAIEGSIEAGWQKLVEPVGKSNGAHRSQFAPVDRVRTLARDEVD